MAKKEIIRKINKFRKALEDNGVRVEKIILYGSHATGEARADSDIDVAVVSPDFGKDRFEEGVMLGRIAGKIDFKIEAIPVSPDSLENDTWLPLIYEIRDKGKEIPAGKSRT